MIESIVILGKVALFCGLGFGVATGFEWFSDIEVKPRNKSIKIGSEPKKEVSENDRKINDISKKVRSQS